MNEQQNNLLQPSALSFAGEPVPAAAAPMPEQPPQRRSVFLADENIIVNTSLRRAQDLKYAIDTELRNQNKDNYFAYERLDESIPDTTHRLWKTPFRAVANAGASMWQAAERTMAGGVGFVKDWYEFGARGREASQKYRDKLAEMEKQTLTVMSSQTLDVRKKRLFDEYLKELNQISADYEENRRLGRNALLVMNENHQHFREAAGIEKNEKDGFIYDLFNAGGSLVFAIGLTALTGSPAAAAIAFGTAAGQQDYEEALQNGVSPNRALLAGIGGGVAEGGIELLGMEMLFKSLTKTGVLGRIAASALSEGSEEAAQQTAEEIIMQNFGGRSQEFTETLQGIGYSFVLGSLTAAPVAVLVNRASAQLQNKGLPQETADKMAVNMARAVAAPENTEAVHNVLSNATSPLVYPEGDVIKGAREFKQTIDNARNPDRETVRAMYNAADKTEQMARTQGFNESEAELLGKLEQSRFNTIHNQAGLKVGEFEETQVEFVAEAPQADPEAVRQDLAAAREKWKQEYEAQKAKKEAASARADEELDQRLAEAGLTADDFFFQEDTYQNGKANTNTPQFKEWFGDSKVVDENGQPLIVYHGTNAIFKEFNHNFEDNGSMLGEGFYLTASKRKSTEYGKNALPLYVSIQNPFIINTDNVLQEINKKLTISKTDIDGWLTYYSGNILQTVNRIFRESNLTDKLKKAGYDGVIFNAGEEIVAFEPQQIKSVYNRGTFEPSSPNIYLQENTAKNEASQKQIRNTADLTEIHSLADGHAIALEINPALNTQRAQVVSVPALQTRISNAKAFKKAVLNDQKSITVTNKNTGDMAVLSQSSMDKIYSSAIRNTETYISGNNIPQPQRQRYYNDALAIARNVQTIFENAAYILQHRDVKGLDRYMKRYASEVNIGDRNYFVMISVKDSGAISGLQLYDVQTEKSLEVISGKTRHLQAQDIITDLMDFVKRKLAKYNNNASRLTASPNELLQENLFDMQLGLFDGTQSLFDTQANAEENNGETLNETELKEAAETLFTQEEMKETLPPFKPTAKPERIEDFGEKIAGARKDLWGKYADAMRTELPADVKEITLSKYFPEPNYENAIARGITVEQLAIVKALRDSIPAKPQAYGIEKWAKGLKAARESANLILSNPARATEFLELTRKLNRNDIFSHGNHPRERAEFYVALGYPAFTKAKAYRFRFGRHHVYNGVRFEQPTVIYELVKGFRSVYASSNPQEVIEHARKLFDANATKTSAPTKLDIYQMRRTGEIVIGKKIASGKYIDLKGGFTRVADAQAFLEANQTHLEALLEEKRRVYPVRREINEERIGKEYRPAGTVVTPERFSQEFGFRGVQFGNWVEQHRRAKDLNNAYDALLDMADIINVPARALSLDGTLGLAFGARGIPGALAHYEHDNVVINLTKKNGAGSLGHEWWHALDNYFGRTSNRDLMITENPGRFDTVRPEMRDAYQQVVIATSQALSVRSQNLDKTRTKDYWSSRVEMTARAFEAYLIYKGKQQGFRNDYLANIVSAEAYKGLKDSYPYPLDSEMPAIAAAFDNFFSVLQTKESPRGYTLYEEDLNATPAAPQSGYRGRVVFNEDNNKAIIYAASRADRSTALHEFFHVYEHDLWRAEKVSTEPEFLKMMHDLRTLYANSAPFVMEYLNNTKLLTDGQRAHILEAIKTRGGEEYIKKLAFADQTNKTDDVTDSFIMRAFREYFTHQAERYFMKGQAPSATYKALFDRFAQWLREIYGALAGVEIAPDVQKFFDKLLTREARRVDSKLFTGKVEELRAQVKNIRQGSPNGSFTLEQIKQLAEVLDAPAPKLPSTHLLKDLKRYGADYAQAGYIDKEIFKQKFIFNKRGGIGDDPARWLTDHGYMSESYGSTYEEQDRLNSTAYAMVERALDGEKIYPAGTEQQVAEYENYKNLMDTVRAVWGEPKEARKTLKAILALEEKGYRVVEKKDLTALSLRLGELNKLADRLDNKSQTVRQKEEADNATLEAARKIRARVVDELNKRQLAGKEDIIKRLNNAKTFSEIQDATAAALDFLQDAYENTEAGQEEKRRTDLPTTDWDNVRAQLLRSYMEAVGHVDDTVKEAWRIRTISTTGSASLYGWSKEELQLRRQQAEKVLKEAEPKMEAALMRAAESVLRSIGGIESDQIRKFVSSYAKSAHRARALYKTYIDNLINQARTAQEDNYKKYMNKKIQDVLNLNLFDKRGNLRKATVDQPTLAALQELKHWANVSKDEAAMELGNRMVRFTETPATPTDKIINELLSIQANDRKDVSMQLYKQAYEDIHSLRRAGRSARNLQKMIMDFRNEQDKSQVLRAVTKNKKAGTLKRMYASWIANWESFLDLVTDGETKEKYSMLNLEADTLTYSWRRRTEIMEGVKRIYGLAGRHEVQNKINALRKEKYTYTNYALVDKNTDQYALKRAGEPFKEEISKMQIITAYIYFQNDVLAERLTQQYGNEQLGAMWALLDKQDMALADFLQKQAEQSYSQINEVFVRERGYDLPRVQKYFPSITERVESELDFMQSAMNMSKNPSFIKARTNSAFIQMKLDNPFGILFRHIDRAADYHFKAEKLNQIRKVFKSPVVKPAIIDKVGEDVYKRMLELIDQFSITKPRVRYDMDKLGDWLTNNYVKGAIALKPTIAIKQLISSINYAENMPSAQWIAGFTDAIMHPKQTVKFMLEGDPYLKARYESGSMNEALARATADANAITASGKFLRFTDLLTINTRLGDIGAIMFGGKPYVDYLMTEKGMSKKDAFAEFRKSTLRSQQANSRSSLSTLQARDMNFIVRGLFAFKNTPAQYARKIADAICQYQRGEISKKQLAKVVAIYGLLNSWMYSLLTSLGLLAWFYDNDEADELLASDLLFSPFTQMAGALPVLDMAVGQAADVALAKMFDHRVRLERPELPVVGELFKMGQKALKEEVTANDVCDMLITGGQLFGGLPTQYAKGIVTGAADVASGENPMRGFLQALGYTENRAQIATNTKE